jgi:sulfonate transport system substrate-binding protein
MSVTKRTFLKVAAAGLLASSLTLAAGSAGAENPERIGLDFAYYNPVSLLIKQKGWVEEEFAKDGIAIEWVQSAGSNKALEFLNAGSIDFGSSAGAAALIAKSNGVPIKSIYVYSKPEWTALVTRADTGIAKIEDLKGKTVAVTRGTDPYIFLLRSLASVGLSEADINVVLLQHSDGANALVTEQVDAWAGLDPFMARTELESGAVLFFRNADWNTYGVLNVREEFAAEHPDAVKRLLAVYEKGRVYAIAHPDELQAVLVEAAKLNPDVAAKQLGERTDLSNPKIGANVRDTLLAAGEILKQVGILKPEVDPAALVDSLLDAQFSEQLAQK